MRSALKVLVACATLLAANVSTAQEPARLALLVGNKSYTAKVGPLKNPHHDVDLIEAALTKLGFKVMKLKDADYRTMDTAIRRYVADVRRAGRGPSASSITRATAWRTRTHRSTT